MSTANRTGELLGQLTETLGHHVELDDLDPACALHTQQVLEWAAAGTEHAALTYQRHLLAGPITFLQQHPDPTHHHLLSDLLDHDGLLDEALDSASRRYATACHTLHTGGSVLTRPLDTDPTGHVANQPIEATTTAEQRPHLHLWSTPDQPADPADT